MGRAGSTTPAPVMQGAKLFTQPQQSPAKLHLLQNPCPADSILLLPQLTPRLFLHEFCPLMNMGVSVVHPCLQLYQASTQLRAKYQASLAKSAPQVFLPFGFVPGGSQQPGERLCPSHPAEHSRVPRAQQVPEVETDVGLGERRSPCLFGFVARALLSVRSVFGLLARNGSQT